ncbi:MBL fold metallo-hydrolase [Lentibacillus salinarum]|uniref:MBL fold metallo-hydrolase n=1 Tax=Lentibacillus salinarum TaxID=446820 RepID=A0ABW3ZR23_9BACI
MEKEHLSRLIRLKEGIHRIGIPVPFPVKYVYCYLMENESGYTLVDTGLNYKKAKAAWEEVFEELAIKPDDIHTIIITHFHPDHSGLAGWMQEKTNANVWMSDTDRKMFQLAFMKNDIQAIDVNKLLSNHGVNEELRKAILNNLENITERVQPYATVNSITKKNWNLDGRAWRILETPGHSQGHLCFYQEDENILLAGDMILDKITPNISLWPGGSDRPLEDYLNSLKDLKQLSISRAWPGHGGIIDEVNKRIDELIEHHENRLNKIADLATQKSGSEIAGELFAEKELNAHQWRFAISETLAHLEYLVDQEKINRIASNPILYTK